MVTAARKSAAKVTPKAKQRADWDAIERDYRTGKFTLRELETKHGTFASSIARKAKSDGWVKDLTEAIRQATNARLTSDLVDGVVNACSQNVNSAVNAAAEVNTRIILGHRTRLASLNDAVEAAKEKLLTLGDTVSDIREAATFVQAVGNLATATKTLIDEERKTYKLDDAPSDAESKHAVTVAFV